MQRKPNVRALLASPRMPWIAALLAFVLALPALRTGLVVDDWFHRAALLQVPPFGRYVPSPLRLFSFVPSDEVGRALVDSGAFPWWTDPHLRIAFFRPVSALTHALDYRLWPDAVWAMHLQTLLWYALLVFAVASLHRRVLAAPIAAAIAALVFAIDPGHAIPVAWLANRNAVVAGAFGALAILLHDRATRDGSKPAAFLSPLLLGLSLGSGETGLGAAGWLASHALFLDEAAPKLRFRRLLPHLFVLALWAVVYRLGAFGTAGSALYVDPTRVPGAYARATVERIPLLLAAGFTIPVPEIYVVASPTTRIALVLAAVAVVGLIVAALWPLLRTRRTTRFYAAGTLLSVLPACATFPAGRLLIFASMGISALVAELVLASGARLSRVVARTVLAAHLVLAPLLFVAMTQAMWLGGELARSLARDLPHDASIEGRDVVMLTALDPISAGYLFVERAMNHEPVPARFETLSTAWDPVTVRRVDERTLALRPKNGFVADELSRLFRDPRTPFDDAPLHVGGMVITVGERTADGRPAEAFFRFDRSVDDRSLLFVACVGDRYRAIAPPKIGDTIELPSRRPL